MPPEGPLHPPANAYLVPIAALLEVVRRWPEVVTSVQVLQIELDGATEWLLTDDLVAARRQVTDRGGVEIAQLSVADVIADQFAGVAALSSFG